MHKKPLIILAVETSCDETATAVVEGNGSDIRVLASVVSSQVTLHAKYGGVVPNLAAREHVTNILPVITEALEKSNTNEHAIDLLAVTHGPGLIPALLVGVDTMRTFAWLWEKPLLGIHHIEGHVYANFLSPNTDVTSEKDVFPLLALVVSGGHTQLMMMPRHGSYEIIGQTQDDAVGEAFDKAARLLGLPYPGGPAIAKHAELVEISDPSIRLPRPMLHSGDLNFSFSGIKTAVLTLIEKNASRKNDASFIASVAKEFQQACVDVLIKKTLSATEAFRPKTVVLAGGVSANLELRRQLGEALENTFPFIDYRVPPLTYSVDNAAMIASAAYFRWIHASADEQTRAFNAWKTLHADANAKLEN